MLLPNVRSSIEHNAAVSARLTESIRKKIQSMQDSGKSDTGIAIEGKQSVTDGNQGNGSTLTDEQRQKVEELLAQNAQSTQSDSNDSGSAAKQDSDGTSSPAKPW